MTVDNIAIPADLEARRTAAMELHAEQTQRMVDLQAAVAAPLLTDPKAERFERVLRSCVEGRVATNVEGFLTFARELCDGIDREFPEATGG